MITLIFTFLLLSVVVKLICLAFKATCGITKVIFSIVLFPAFLVVLAVSGLMFVAIPILIVAGIVLLIKTVAV